MRRFPFLAASMFSSVASAMRPSNGEKKIGFLLFVCLARFAALSAITIFGGYFNARRMSAKSRGPSRRMILLIHKPLYIRRGVWHSHLKIRRHCVHIIILANSEKTLKIAFIIHRNIQINWQRERGKGERDRENETVWEKESERVVYISGSFFNESYKKFTDIVTIYGVKLVIYRRR